MDTPGRAPRLDGPSRFFAAVIALNLLLLAFYQFVTNRYTASADAFTRIVHAQEMIRGGTPFPPEWNYFNADIHAFFTNTVAVPFVALLGPGYAAYALTGLCVSLLLLALTWMLLRELPHARWQRLAMLALLAGGLSSLLQEDLYGQAAYGCVVLLNVGALWSALRFARHFRPGETPDRKSLALLALFSAMASWNNPLRTIVLVSLPFLAACVVNAQARLGSGRMTRASLRALPEGWLALTHLGGLAAGAAGHVWVLSGPVHNVYSAALATWLDWREMPLHAGYAVAGVLAHLGGLPAQGMAVVSAWGAYETLRLALGLLLLWAVVRAPLQLARHAAPPLRFLAVFVLCSAALVLLFHVFTTLPDMSSPLIVGRYLTPPLFVALLLLPALMPRAIHRGQWAGMPLAADVAALSLLGAATLVLPDYPGNGRQWRQGLHDGQHRMALMDFLNGQGLRYGYATFWNAVPVTVLSGGTVRVRQINFDEGMPMPMRHLGSNRWYWPDQWQGETFLMLTAAEWQKVHREALDARLGPPLRILRFDNFIIQVYAGNPADKLDWDNRLAVPSSLDVTPRTPHMIGRYEALAIDQGRLVSGGGESGPLMVGPYKSLPAGRYRASFDIAVQRGGGAAGQAPATLEVTHRAGKVRLASRALPDSVPRGWQSLDFELPRGVSSLEFPVLAGGTGRVELYGVRLEHAP